MFIKLIRAFLTAAAAAFLASMHVPVDVFAQAANPRFHSLSTRGTVDPGGHSLDAGFIIEGTAAVDVIIRALGPSLPVDLVPTPLQDPEIRLHRNGVLEASNTRYEDDSEVGRILQHGLEPPHGNEAALIRTLDPGAYSVEVLPGETGAGISLLQVIKGSPGMDGHLTSISTLGNVGFGNNVMIAGFIVEGDRPMRVLIRGLGPSLEGTGVLGDPVLQLYKDQSHQGLESSLFRENRRWHEDPDQAEVVGEGMAPGHEDEAAMLVSLHPGIYTAVLRGHNGSTGNGIIEVVLMDTPHAHGELLWWEAEDPVATNFPPASENPFGPETEQEKLTLSDGAWIGVSGDRAETLFLEYDVEVPESGLWHFYTRRFWHHGPFRWRFDDGPWTEVTSRSGLLDSVSLRLHVGANWIALGEVYLPAGVRRLRVELLENDGAAAFDAFVLSGSPFIPRGPLKPNESYGRAPDGWFPFEQAPDGFADSPIDLRNLNEAYAGENGRIAVQDGRFVHGNTGQPVRFWAVNAGPNIVNFDNASHEYLARQLAKYGVNMLRIHGLPAGGEGTGKLELNPHTVERMQHLVAALKREGIYTCLSLYFPLWVRLDAGDGFPGYDGQHPFALNFFHPEYQEILRSWWKGVLRSPNPYGPPLADEPAVAQFELVNEDGYFFWTFTPGNNVPWPVMEVLEEQFGDWAADRYGSLEEARSAWGGTSHPRDNLDAGRLGLPAAGDIIPQSDQQRTRDAARFLAESQADWFQNEAAFLRDELGYGGLVQGSNWITADARRLGPLDKWSNTVVDYMDRHGYFGGRHEGDRSSFALSAGDTFRERTALRFEDQDGNPAANFSLPLADIRYNGMPSIISEINWTPPGRFRTEFPALASVYGSLQRQDGFYFFALGEATWQGALTKFPVQIPSIMGQFPALAWIYRMGLIEEGPVVADIRLSHDALFGLEGGPVAMPQNLDEFREADIPPGGDLVSDETPTIDPLAHYTGQVHFRFVEEAENSSITDLSPYIDRDAKIIRSVTGEIEWDFGQGLLTVDAPKAAMIGGFFKPGIEHEAGTLLFETTLEYGSAVLVSLDGQPLNTSGRMLLQVMSEDSNYGWEESGAPTKTIQNLGIPPLIVRELDGEIRLNRPDSASLTVTALDLNGYPVSTHGAPTPLNLLPDVLYYLIED